MTRPALAPGLLVRLSPAGAEMNPDLATTVGIIENVADDWSAAAVVFPVPDGSLHTTIRAEWLEALS